MKKQSALAFLALATVAGLSGCASSKPVAGLPDWWDKRDPAPFHGYGMHRSTDLQLAKEQAEVNACQDVAKTISAKYTASYEAYRHETKSGQAESPADRDVKNTLRTLVNQNLSGCAIQQTKTIRDGGYYEVYAEAFLDSKGALEALKNAQAVEKVQGDSKAAFDELERLIDKQENSKK